MTENTILTFNKALKEIANSDTFLIERGIKMLKQIQDDYVRYLRTYKTKRDTNSSFSTIKKELLDYIGFVTNDLKVKIDEYNSK